MGLPRKIGVSGAVMLAFGVTFGFIVFPYMLKLQVLEGSSLKNGSAIREMWSKAPFPLQFDVYIFNVTNPTEVTNGEKPILHEIGPYVYDEWVEKVDLEDREDDDTLEYSRRTTLIFNPAKSEPLTGNEIVTIPHFFILGALMTIVRDNPSAIRFAGKAIDSIFNKPDSIFVRTSVHDFLFGGLPINCNVKDFVGTVVCDILKDVPELIKDGEKHYRISMLGHTNGTVDSDRIRIKRGLTDVSQVGQVTEYKGESEQTVWSNGSSCNVINGTDGTIMRPYLVEGEDIVSFDPDMCRAFTNRWDGTFTSIGGIHANHYTLDLGDPSSEPGLNCFCDTEDTCTKKGLYDMHKCAGVPIVISLPHFYNTDDMYLKQVVGLHPSKMAHQSDFDIEPITGTIVSARNRLQINMFVFPIEKLRIMRTFATALMPILWIDENFTIPDGILDQVRMLLMAINMIGTVKWIMIILGTALCGAGAAMEFKRRQVETDIKSLIRKHIESGNVDSLEKKKPLEEKVPPHYI